MAGLHICFKAGISAVLAAICFFYGTASYGIDKKKLDAAGFQELNQEAPDFTLKGAAGGKISLRDFRGKVVVIHVWATWCKPCREEFPLFERLYQHFHNRGVVFLPVAIDPVAAYKEVSLYAKSLGATFQVYLAKDGSISDRYWTWGVPVTYFIGKKGWIVGRAIGPRDWNSDAVYNLINALLEE